MKSRACVIGIDSGSTSAKVAAFDARGDEICAFAAPNPRVATAKDRQEIDMDALWRTVAGVLRQLTARLAEDGWSIAGVSSTGHGNGLYLTDSKLRPVRTAIASTDNRAERIAAAIDPATAERTQALTGSMPWAAQPNVLLRWLHEHEPDALIRARWALTCKDWINACLTGKASAELSDSSGCGLVDLGRREYSSDAFDMLELPHSVRDLLPPLLASNAIVGGVTPEAAKLTGLPTDTPVTAGCMDCVASPLGAGVTGVGDVTIIVGTWAINSVVAPSDAPPPRLTLNSLLPEDGLMLAQEVAPTSSASIDWFLRTSPAPTSAQAMMDAAAEVPAGVDGPLFFPFVHGAPDHAGASGAFLGARGNHGYAQMARAVIEGVTQYHRIQLDKMRRTGVKMSEHPWTLAGGGANSAVWAQMFADIVGHPVRRRMGKELGARGVASLAAANAGWRLQTWNEAIDPSLVVEPGPNYPIYQRQNERYDRVLAALLPVWRDAVQ